MWVHYLVDEAIDSCNPVESTENPSQETQLKAACSDKFNEIDEKIREQKQIFSSLKYVVSEHMI